MLKALNPLKPENTLGLSSLDVSIGLEPKLPENNENGVAGGLEVVSATRRLATSFLRDCIFVFTSSVNGSSC